MVHSIGHMQQATIKVYNETSIKGHIRYNNIVLLYRDIMEPLLMDISDIMYNFIGTQGNPY